MGGPSCELKIGPKLEIWFFELGGVFSQVQTNDDRGKSMMITILWTQVLV